MRTGLPSPMVSICRILIESHLRFMIAYSYALGVGYQQFKPTPHDYGWQAPKGKGKGKGKDKGQKLAWGGQRQAVPRQTTGESPIETGPTKKPRCAHIFFLCKFHFAPFDVTGQER